MRKLRKNWDSLRKKESCFIDIILRQDAASCRWDRSGLDGASLKRARGEAIRVIQDHSLKAEHHQGECGYAATCGNCWVLCCVHLCSIWTAIIYFQGFWNLFLELLLMFVCLFVAWVFPSFIVSVAAIWRDWALEWVKRKYCTTDPTKILSL